MESWCNNPGSGTVLHGPISDASIKQARTGVVLRTPDRSSVQRPSFLLFSLRGDMATMAHFVCRELRSIIARNRTDGGCGKGGFNVKQTPVRAFEIHDIYSALGILVINHWLPESCIYNRYIVATIDRAPHTLRIYLLVYR